MPSPLLFTRGLKQHYLFIIGLAIVIDGFLVTGCGAAKANAHAPRSVAGAPSIAVTAEAAPASADNGYIDVNTDRSLNTSSYVRAWADGLLETASRFRRELYRLDGYVLAERIDYEDEMRVSKSTLSRRAPKREKQQAIFEISLPTEKLPEILDWLRMQSIIVEQYVVSNRDGALPQPTIVATSEKAQASIAQRLADIDRTLGQADEPLQTQLETERAALVQRLEREQERTRLPDIRMATLTVHFESDQPQVRFAASRLVPTVRTSMFISDLLEQDGERQTRLGAALGFGLPSPGRGGLIPSPMLELAGYPATSEHDAGLTITVGGGLYARSFGDGARTVFNPFAGLRIGYAYFDRHAFTVAGELGVELFKAGGIAWSASVRPHGLIGKDANMALEAGTSLSIGF